MCHRWQQPLIMMVLIASKHLLTYLLINFINRMGLLSPSNVSSPDNHFCLGFARSTFVLLQVLSSFALSSVSSSSCLSGPGGGMNHCYESISDMLFAVFLPASLCACCCTFIYLSASLWFAPSVPHLQCTFLYLVKMYQPTKHPQDGIHFGDC